MERKNTLSADIAVLKDENKFLNCLKNLKKR